MDHIVDNESICGSRSLHRRAITISKHQQSQLQQSQTRNILEEEEYTSTLTHIVTRDYYPALHTLRRDAAILDARGRGDISEAVAIRRKYRTEEMQREREWMEELHEEEDALALRCEDENAGGIDNDTGQRIAQVRKRPRPLKHESITGFHARVTSEDNAEFEINQERERKEREEFLSLVYDARADKCGRLMIENQLQSRKDGVDGNAGDGERLLGGSENTTSTSNIPNMRALCDTPIGLSSDLFDAPPSAGLRITNGAHGNEATTGNNRIGRNGLFFQPQHHISVNAISSGGIPKSTPSSSGTFLALESNDATGGKLREQESIVADNRLMPPPPSRLLPTSSSIVSRNPSDDKTATPHPTKSTPPLDHRYQLVEYLPKQTLPDIHPPATRFPYQNESRLLLNNNSSNRSTLYPLNRNSMGDSIGSYSTDASDTTDLDESPRPLHTERAAYQRARIRENETFLPMTPLIRPGRGGEEVEPDANWPQVVGSGAVPSSTWEPTFDVVDENDREKVARKAEKHILERSKTYRSAGKSKRDRADKDDESIASFRSTSTNPLDRKASLTPAARALLESSRHARKSTKKSHLLSTSSHPSRIFSSSSNAFGTNAGSRDSFGSSLRMSYTPHRSGENAGKQSTSSLRLSVAGATPR